MNLLHLCLAYCIIVTGVGGSSCPVRDGELSVLSIPVTLRSPNYGSGNYPKDVHCSWTLRASRAPYRVRMQVLDLDLEKNDDCSYDYLQVKDTDNRLLGRLCGTTRGTFRSTGSRLYLSFKTDGSVQRRGFKVQFSLDTGEDATATTVPPEIHSCPTRNDDTFTASHSYTIIKSEGYPGGYPKDSLCMWNLRAATAGYVVKLEVVDSDLESSSSCSYDSLAAYNGYSEMSSSSLIRKWCGYTAPTVFSSGRYMTLVFESDDSVEGRGFHLRFMQVPESEAESYSSRGVTIGVVSAVVFVVFIVVVCISCFIRARVASSRRSGARQQQAALRGNVTSAGVAATSASRHLGFTGGALYNREASSVSLPQPLDPPAFAPPPYPGGPDPSTLPKDDPPPYWMAAMYTVDPGAQHLPKPEGHVPDDVTSAPAPQAHAPPPPPAPAPPAPAPAPVPAPHAPVPHASAPPPPPAPHAPPHAPAPAPAPAPSASAAHAAAGSVEPSAPFPSGEGAGDLTASGVARGGAGVAPSGGEVGRDNRGYTHDDYV